MSAALLFQLGVYELLEVVPFALLTAAAFKEQVRSRPRLAVGVAALYVLGMLRRLLSLWGASDVGLSVLWILIYLAACRLVLSTSLPKLLFVLMTVLNYGSLVAILGGFTGVRLSAARLEAFPYCLEASATLLPFLLLTYPQAYRFLSRRVRALTASTEQERLWRYLWLVPATFCMIFYYSLYNGGGVLAFASGLRNALYVVAVSAGGLFVLYLTVRMMEESLLALRLRTENGQLALRTVQYENLKSRMEEACRARHDLRQCMAVLEEFLRREDTAAMRRFISQYLQTLPADIPLVYTKNAPLNALIRYYADLAAAQQTRFDAQVNYPEAGLLPDVDAVVLLGNLLENALEACGRQTAGARSIRLTVRANRSTLVILLENTCQEAPVPEAGRFRSSKRAGAGLGTLSVRQIAARYHGAARFEFIEGVFRASVLLNLQRSGTHA